MLGTRGCFLKNLAGVSSSFLRLQSSPPIPEPRRRTPVDPPTPAEKQDQDNPVDTSRTVKRAQLQAQEREFRETMARLFPKVRYPNLHLHTPHPSNVFSTPTFNQPH